MNRAYLFFASRLWSSRAAEKSYRKMRSAVLGIALSLIPLIVVLQVADGMIEGITRRYLEVGSFHIQVRSFQDHDDEELSRIVSAVREVDSVVDAFAFVEGLALARGEGRRSGVAVRAFPADLPERDVQFRSYITVEAGQFDLGKEDAVVVTVDVARKLGLAPGDGLRLLTARSVGGGRLLPRQTSVVVAGVVTTGYHDLDALTVILPYERGRDIFREPGAVSIGVKIEDPYDSAGRIARTLESVVPANWQVYTWYELERSMYNEFRSTKNMLVVVMAVIVMVASMTISGSLVLLVSEKQPEIAVIKTFGATSRRVGGTFIFAGFLVGAVGTFVGVAAGLLIAVNINEVIRVVEAIASAVSYVVAFALSGGGADVVFERVEILGSSYYLDVIPIKLRAADVVLVACLSIGLSTLSAWWPARVASRVNPVEFLRPH